MQKTSLMLILIILQSCLSALYHDSEKFKSERENIRADFENRRIGDENKHNLEKAKEFESEINKKLLNKYVLLSSFNNPLVDCGTDRDKDFFLKKLFFKGISLDTQHLSSISANIRFETEKKETIIFTPLLSNSTDSDSYIHFCFIESSKNKVYQYSSSDKNLIRNNQIRIGFNKDQVRLSIGNPDKINYTNSASNQSEQWVYGHNYVYLRNGIVTTIQQR